MRPNDALLPGLDKRRTNLSISEMIIRDRHATEHYYVVSAPFLHFQVDYREYCSSYTMDSLGRRDVIVYFTHSSS